MNASHHCYSRNICTTSQKNKAHLSYQSIPSNAINDHDTLIACKLKQIKGAIQTKFKLSTVNKAYKFPRNAAIVDDGDSEEDAARHCDTQESIYAHHDLILKMKSNINFNYRKTANRQNSRNFKGFVAGKSAMNSSAMHKPKLSDITLFKVKKMPNSVLFNKRGVSYHRKVVSRIMFPNLFSMND